ncbi:hypothetical protein BST61_g5609 [Cercospora zeina]
MAEPEERRRRIPARSAVQVHIPVPSISPSVTTAHYEIVETLVRRRFFGASQHLKVDGGRTWKIPPTAFPYGTLPDTPFLPSVHVKAAVSAALAVPFSGLLSSVATQRWNV